MSLGLLKDLGINLPLFYHFPSKDERERRRRGMRRRIIKRRIENCGGVEKRRLK